MWYKLLKHKTEPNGYGVIEQKDQNDTVIYLRKVPDLIPTYCTLDLLKEAYKDNTAYDQLDQYELVEVLLIQQDSPLKL